MRALACAVLYPMITSLVCRAILYGVADTNVYRMMLYLILPLLLFISLNVLFRLIKMYRYGLQVLQAQKEKEKGKETEKEGIKEKEDWTVCFETFFSAVFLRALPILSVEAFSRLEAPQEPCFTALSRSLTNGLVQSLGFDRVVYSI